MSLCKSIDTLSMAYLDDELAAEERHELEAHLLECASCRAHLESERADLSMVRRALAVPPASDMLRARIGKALDQEERVGARRRFGQWLLPGSALAAAAAAIAVFVGMQAPARQPVVAVPNVTTNVVRDDIARFGRRAMPLEVQGAGTGSWLQQTFAADIAPPRFDDPSTELLGGRLLPGGINGHDAAYLAYQVRFVDRRPFQLALLIVHDLKGGELRDGMPVELNGRTLYVFKSSQGDDVVSYVPREGTGFMFMAPDLTVNELLRLASRVNLVSE